MALVAKPSFPAIPASWMGGEPAVPAASGDGGTCESGRWPLAEKVSVAEVAARLNDFLKEVGTRDLNHICTRLTKPFSHTTAPQVSELAAWPQLFLRLLDLAPCGRLPPSGLHKAILALHANAPVKFSHMDMDDWAAAVGGSIRTTFSKYRWLKSDLKQRTITLGKATSGIKCARACCASFQLRTFDF